MIRRKTKTRPGGISPEELSHKIAKLSFLKKAEDVIILDLRKLTSMTDFFVICSGESEVQVKAITDSVLDGLIDDRIKPWHKEGMNGNSWVLLDFVDVVVHIFHTKSREYYQLESLWGDAETITLTDAMEINSGEL